MCKNRLEAVLEAVVNLAGTINYMMNHKSFPSDSSFKQWQISEAGNGWANY